MQIRATVGEVEDVDVLDDGVGWGEYLRVKICIDLSKPLAQDQRDMCARVQEENGLFVHGSYLPTMETDVEGRREMGDSGVNVVSLNGKAMKSSMKEGWMSRDMPRKKITANMTDMAEYGKSFNVYIGQ